MLGSSRRGAITTTLYTPRPGEEWADRIVDISATCPLPIGFVTSGDNITATCPMPVGAISASVNYQDIAGTCPMPYGAMTGGDFITASCPMPIGAITATNTVLSDIAGVMPRAVGSMTATNGCFADISGVMPKAVASMNGGDEITATCPMPVGAMGGVIGGVTDITATMPMPIGAMSVTSSNSVVNIAGICPHPVSIYNDISATCPMPIGMMDATVDTANLIAYVMNIKTAETTTYSNYAFKFYFRAGFEYYGVGNDNKLYQLTGTTDAGTAIDARFKTAQNDMKTSNLKRVPYCYADSDKPVNITPYADSINSGTFLSHASGRRTHLARGPKGKFWQFEVSNVNGNEMKVGSLEALPEVLSRKI